MTHNLDRIIITHNLPSTQLDKKHNVTVTAETLVSRFLCIGAVNRGMVHNITHNKRV